MVPVRTLGKASSVKRIKTIRLGYVLDAATFDVMDIMALMVFSVRFCAFKQRLIEETKFKGERSLGEITDFFQIFRTFLFFLYKVIKTSILFYMEKKNIVPLNLNYYL